jgi:hypothetical protein
MVCAILSFFQKYLDSFNTMTYLVGGGEGGLCKLLPSKE